MKTRFAALALWLGLVPGVALAERTPEQLSRLKRELGSTERTTRESALEALRGDGSPGAIELLLLGIADADDDLARRALFYVVDALPLAKDPAPIVRALLAAALDIRTELRVSALETLPLVVASAPGDEALRAEVVDLLVRAFGDGISRVRLAAVNALARLNPSGTTVILCDRLQDFDTGVKQRAAVVLGELGDPSALFPLSWAAADANPEVRQAAVQALGRLGDPRALPTLRIAITDGSAVVRLRAAEALGAVGGEGAVDALLPALADPDARVLQAAVLSLGRLGDARAVGPLVSLIASSRLDENFIKEALGGFGAAAVPELRAQLGRSRNSTAGVAALQALEQNLSPEATELLLWEDLRLSDRALSFRLAWIKALGQRRDPRVMSVLLYAMRDRDAEIRLAALDAFPRPVPEEAISSLVDLLQQPWMRSRVVGLLLEAEPSAVAPAAAAVQSVVLDLLKNNEGSDDELETLYNALLLLSRVAPVEAADLLFSQLRSEFPSMRAAAGSFLWMAEGPTLSARLLAIAKDNKEPGRVHALRALYRVLMVRPDEAIIAKIAPLADDPDTQLSGLALRVLCLSKDPRYTSRLLRAMASSDPWRPRALAAVLPDWSPEDAVLPLLQALRSPDSITRINAAWALGKTRDPRAVAPLQEALEAGLSARDRAERTEGLVALNAAWALGALGDASAIPLLERGLEAPYGPLRANCAGSLIRLGRRELVLARLQTETDRVVLEAALRELWWSQDPAARAALEQATSWSGLAGSTARALVAAAPTRGTLGYFADTAGSDREPLRGVVYLLKTWEGPVKASISDVHGDISEPVLEGRIQGAEALGISAFR